MASLVANTSNGVSRNKRKFRPDPPRGDPNKLFSLSDNDIPIYEFPFQNNQSTETQKNHIGCDMCHSDPLNLSLGLSTWVGSSALSPRQPKHENDVAYDFGDWTDLTETELKELVLNNLETIFKGAIKKVVAYGYTEEVVNKSVLRSGVYYGPKDMLSNIVDNTLLFIRNGHGNDPSKEHYFENLEQLEKYILAELVCILREVRPSFSTGDALWCLLLCDMNVTNACNLEDNTLQPLQPKTKTETPSSEFRFSASSKPKKPYVSPISLTENQNKSVCARKIPGIRQKSLHTERAYRSYGSKGSSRSAKHGSFNFKNVKTKEKKIDTKDLILARLLPRERVLRADLGKWDEWANRKVMQAAKRLGEDKAELKALRAEREDRERGRREKQALEESTAKKLAELESAFCKAGGQMEWASGAVRRLEGEKAWLRRENEAARVAAKEAAARCREGGRREKEAAARVGKWEKERALFREEIENEKKRLVEMDRDMELAKDRRDREEARWKQEVKAKENLLKEANSVRREREELESFAKAQEETIKSNAETNLKKYKDDIQKLEKEISSLRLKNDSSKIAAMKRGAEQTNPNKDQIRNMSKKIIANLGDEFPGVKRERECVMCLSEEMSVVFLPCAHQVVCSNCNELHEKQGMKDCPSCRSPIQQRISVRYARH